MPWIHVLSPDEAAADKQLGRLLDGHAEDGEVDNILRIHSLHPASLRAHLLLYKTLMYGPGPLDRAQREMIAVAVSAANDCRYWTVHHGAGLRALTGDPDLAAAIAADPTTAPVSGAERAMLAYAVKLTRTPGAMVEADVEALRAVGWSDRAILDINQIAGYYAYVNRLADGLGVELEDRWGTSALEGDP